MTTPADLANRIRHAGGFVPLQPIGKPIDDKAPPVLPPNFTAVAQIQMPANAEMLMALAKAERPCPPVGTGPDGTCTTCEGRGRIPLFPALREPCRLWYAERGYHVHLSAFGTGVCDNCHLHRSQSKEECEASCHCAGRGWVPIQEERVAEAILPFVGMEKAVALVAKAYELLHASKVATWTQGFLAALVLALAEEKP